MILSCCHGLGDVDEKIRPALQKAHVVSAVSGKLNSMENMSSALAISKALVEDASVSAEVMDLAERPLIVAMMTLLTWKTSGGATSADGLPNWDSVVDARNLLRSSSTMARQIGNLPVTGQIIEEIDKRMADVLKFRLSVTRLEVLAHQLQQVGGLDIKGNPWFRLISHPLRSVSLQLAAKIVYWNRAPKHVFYMTCQYEHGK